MAVRMMTMAPPVPCHPDVASLMMVGMVMAMVLKSMMMPACLRRR